MRISIGQKLTLSFLLVALLVGLLGFVGYSNMRETAKQVDVITDLEIPGLVKLTQMKSQILEGIEEAFAYPLLNDPLEKAEFYEKLDQFDTFAAEFEEIALIGRRGQEEETELFNQIVTAKVALVIAAGSMFESYERDGTVNQSRVAVLPGQTGGIRRISTDDAGPRLLLAGLEPASMRAAGWPATRRAATFIRPELAKGRR